MGGVGGGDSSGEDGLHLVVFDFDHTVVEVNSDPAAILGVDAEHREEHEALLREAGSRGEWTQGMDAALRRVADHGRTQEDIRDVLRGVGLTEPGDVMLGALQRLASHPGTDLRIVSDANTVFIDEILSAHRIRDAFSAVVSNPASWVPHNTGTRLRVTPFHGAPSTSGPDDDDLDAPGRSERTAADAGGGLRPAHTCPRCPRNLCKGEVVTSWLCERAWTSITYVGDGRNDVCPSLLLPAAAPPTSTVPSWTGGRVLARDGFPLAAALRAADPPLRAALHVWHDATALARLLDPSAAAV